MKEYCSTLGIGDYLYSINSTTFKIQRFIIREVIFSDTYPTYYNDIIKYVAMC